MLDNLMEGFQLISFDWRYLYVNESVVKQSKYSSKNDLLGYTMMEKYPGIENTDMFKVLQECMKARISKNYENEFTFPDGSKQSFELRIEPVDEGLFILSLDISDRKKAEQDKKAFIAGLRQMMFMTSQRVRQPISNIIGVINLIENSKLSAEELREFVGWMKESAQSLDTFMRELIDFIHEQDVKVRNNNWE